MQPRQNWAIHPISDTLDSLEHGETLVKFVAKDEGSEDGDFTVEIHGFVTSMGELLIYGERVTPIEKKSP